MFRPLMLPALVLFLLCSVPSIFAQAPASNPNLSPGCPMNIIFVMDESGSIAGSGNGTSNVSNAVRNGASGLLNALVGTNSRVAIVEFNSTARRATVGGTTDFQEVNATTIADFMDYLGDNNTAPESNHYDPEDYLSNNQTTFTNWQDALVLTKNINATNGLAQLVVFFTDGNATAYNKSTGGFQTGTTSTVMATALTNATNAANQVKAQGSHIFVIGFPNPNLPEGNLQAISGTERYPDAQPDFTLGDYAVSSSGTLQADINAIGVVVCHADLRLTKTANATLSCQNNNVTFTLSIINEGLLNATGVVVKDYLPSGYTYVSNNGGASFSAGTLTWNVGNLNYLQTKSLQIVASVKGTGNYLNTAEVTACNQDDGDSHPNNGVTTEDDYASAGITGLLNCDDGVTCTLDNCANGACTHAPNPACCSSATQCNDNNACTADDCVNGLCSNILSSSCCTTNADCADEDGCTQDICNAGTCSNISNCDDGDLCTADACDNGACTHINITCNDNNLCTNDFCFEGNCIYPALNCFDSNSCTADACVNGNCTHTAVVCLDANPCTNDICAGGICRFIPKNCNDANSCTNDACVNGVCVNTPMNCSDNNPCTIDICSNGVCSSSALNCDDENANTIDVCVEGSCVHTFVSCDNPSPLHILFVLDESGSISGFGAGTSNVSAQVRNGASSMFNSLVGTNTKIAVVEFNTTARRSLIGGTTGFRQITTSNLAEYLDYISDNNLSADNNHYDPEDYSTNQSGTFTNWDGVLQLVQAINTAEGVAPLVIFFTDGKPTAYNTSSGSVTTGSTPAFEATALTEAVATADLVKAQGSHIFVVGIPNPTLPESNIKAISGQKRYPDIEPVFTNADYSISTSQSLQNDLSHIGGLLCRADLSLKSTVNQPVACTGSSLIFTLSITNNGLENANGVVVKDYIPNGLTYVSNNGGASFAADALTWNVGNLNNGQTKTLQITVTINATGNYKNAAEIIASNQEDSDSYPNNYNGNTVLEDDETAITVAMNCNCFLKINSLSIMYEGMFGAVGELTDGKVINQDTLCRWNVRANLCQPTVGSVKFIINGSVFRQENTAPYALNGDQPSGFYTPWIPNPGNYTLTVVAYSGGNATGTAGSSYTVHFTVVAGQSNAFCQGPPVIDCAGKINGAAFLDDCGICSGGTSGHEANSNKDRCGVCNGDGSSCCITDAECSDNNLCTFDFCNNADCEFISNNVDDGNACTVDGCNPQTGEFYAVPKDCDDANDCTQDDCDSQTGCQHSASEGCCLSSGDCNDNDACTLNACTDNQCVFTPASCDDNINCTSDACDNQTGCQHTLAEACCTTANDCNDNDACTANACQDNQCMFTALSCNDNNSCTTDACDILAGCQHSSTEGCCTAAAECNDSDACTTDACQDNACTHSAIGNLPAYLKVVNPATSYRKTRIGYSSTGLFTPKMNVIAGGNTQLCITLKDVNGTAQWSKIKVKPQGASSPVITLGSYVPANPGTGYFTVCIPLSVFPSVDFTQLSNIEFQLNNAVAFEIHIQTIEFTGGSSPFVWFGGAHTNNYHDGTSGASSELITTTVAGSPCGTPKMANENGVATHGSTSFSLASYPNPFSSQLTIEFMLQQDSKAALEIFSVAGQKIATIFEGDVKAGELQKYEYTPATLSNGMVIYRLQTGTDTFYGKAVMVK